MASNIARFDTVREINFAAITATFAPLGSALGHAMRVLHFINATNGDMAISFDGTTFNIPVLAGTFSLYDLTSDQDGNESFRYQLGTQISIKYITGPATQGDFYVVAVYGKGE